ncbi:MAG: glycosyltransferase family 2 protein [Lachnospiraceae bacterium]|nr:glycosyltransferase family 2 protein [Lachnoclostridium sp.]MDD7521219.1 glycosyltransferase family 2 protein [Lachnoclostridium sp.]MDY2599028.1 glycosyltransferase family 2 protein [Lachnospiraceae bacterium]
MDKILYMVVPCYNEEAVLEETTARLREKFESLIKEDKISPKSKVLYVNDGSKDKTWNLIKQIHEKDKMFRGICLSRNRGHQNAVLCGLMQAKEEADMVISMDADLQDDINAIDEMVDKYHEGFDVVYGVRNSRKTDTFFKRFTAQAYYKMLLFMGVDIVYNHADFRLMSKRVLKEMENYKEVNLFLRGIVPMIGFPSTNVYYERHERFAGESKYPLKKMLHFAFDGITSLSVKPIRLITTVGAGIFFLSICMLIYSIVIHFLGKSLVGWSSLMVSVWALGGLQIFSIGVIGEYIGKIYMETKARPRFIVQEYLNDDEE